MLVLCCFQECEHALGYESETRRAAAVRMFLSPTATGRISYTPDHIVAKVTAR